MASAVASLKIDRPEITVKQAWDRIATLSDPLPFVPCCSGGLAGQGVEPLQHSAASLSGENVRRNRSSKRFEIVVCKRVSRVPASAASRWRRLSPRDPAAGAVPAPTPAAGRRCLILFDQARKAFERAAVCGALVVEEHLQQLFAQLGGVPCQQPAGTWDRPPGLIRSWDASRRARPLLAEPARMIRRAKRAGTRKGVIEHQLGETIGDRLELNEPTFFTQLASRAPFPGPARSG